MSNFGFSIFLIFIGFISVIGDENLPVSSITIPLSLHTSTKKMMAPHSRFLIRSDWDYGTTIGVGSPPQIVHVRIDTRSSLTYVRCCAECNFNEDKVFQPDLSNSYKPVMCNKNCICNSNRRQCTYQRQYAGMGFSSGLLIEDVVSVGYGSVLEHHFLTFGCEKDVQGDFGSRASDGMMGLGRGHLSIIDQLVKKGVIRDSFSLCFGGMDMDEGILVLGGISPPTDMVFTLSDPVRSPYYNIALEQLHVAGKPLILDPEVFDGKHGTVLDSGTSYTYLPEPAFVAFKAAIEENVPHLKQIDGPSPHLDDICYAGAGSDASELWKTFPKVDMVFASGKKLSLTPENYLFRHSQLRGAYCLGVFQNGKDPTTVLGGILVRNTLVTFDRENTKVGFKKTTCSLPWKEVNITANSSMDGEKNNSIRGFPPEMAPNENPGKSNIGDIAFSLILTMNYSSFKPRIREFQQFIARSLEAKASEVTVLNYSVIGNETLVRCYIHPTDACISNDAFKNFKEFVRHELILPATFGSYQLVEWKVEPRSKCSWWERYNRVLLGLLVATALLVVTGCAVYGLWFVWTHRYQVWDLWRRRQTALGRPNPVGVLAHEEELENLWNWGLDVYRFSRAGSR